MMDAWIIGETYLSWTSSVTGMGWICIAVAIVTVWCTLRLFWGRAIVRPRFGLWILRALAIGAVALILCGPTHVDEQAGEMVRPSVAYLFDGSQSMKLGGESSRWQEGLQFVADAEAIAGVEDTSHCQTFRFGHRLQPLATENTSDPSDPATLASASSNPSASITLTSGSAAAAIQSSIAPPEATDTRLADAFRQLLPHINSQSSAGVVLVSDGRVRASESVEKLAEFIGDSGVPINVVPIGQVTGTGDVAVVSLVVPDRVRKYTENEIQVFIRSFGFTGKRTVVRIISNSRSSNNEAAVLSSVPITLADGAQSVPLTFRVDERPEDLEVIVDPIEGELTERNNRVKTHVEIDRTKVRVIYVTGEQLIDQPTAPSNPFTAFLLGGNQVTQNVQTVRDALMSDEDLECSTLLSSNQSAPVANISQLVISSFPRTRAELFAYDCVIFSEVSPNFLEQEQQDWLADWIQGRGGGLVVTGGDALRPQDWKDSPLGPLLPVEMSQVLPSSKQRQSVSPTRQEHAIWGLRLDQASNKQLLQQMPALLLSGSGYRAKSTARVLATINDGSEPCVMAHRAGRGRVLVSSASLGGSAFSILAQNWGPQPERVAPKLWRNIVYWATEGSSNGRRRLTTRSDKRFYRPGERLTITASAFDEFAQHTNKYRLWGMFEPASLDVTTQYSPILWPDNLVRTSGEVGPRIAWCEEFKLQKAPNNSDYRIDLNLSEAEGAGDEGFRVVLTAYEGEEPESGFDHGTQVDSASMSIQVLSDPFEQQNPLPNHELMQRIAKISGGHVLNDPNELAALLQQREKTEGPKTRELTPAWSQWWLWIGLLGLISTEWIWRRVTGLA